MAKHRKVIIKNEDKIPIDSRALKKLVLHYYKGKNNVEINFDDRGTGYGSFEYVSATKTHYITMSPRYCTHWRLTPYNTDWETLKRSAKLTELNEYDRIALVIGTVLHELKHAMQCEANPIRYAKCQDDKHSTIKNPELRYEYSRLESEAEGWSLLNVHKAIERYDQWCSEGKSST